VTASLFGGRAVAFSAVLLSAGLAAAAAASPPLALAGLAGALLLIAVVTWAAAVMLLLIAVLPWEGLLEFPTETLSLVKILGVLLMTAYLFRALSRTERVVLPRTLLPVMMLGLFVGASLVFSPEPSEGAGKVLRYALFIVFFFLVVQLVRTRPMIVASLRVFTLSASVAALWGLVAFLGGDVDRAGGPIDDPNDFAYLIATVLPIAGYLLAQEGGRRWLWGACFVVLLAGLFATLSRGAIVGMAALGLWAIATRRVPLGGLLAAAISIVGVLFVSFAFWSPLINERIERKSRVATKNIETRERYWVAAGEMALDRPITGVGPARFDEEFGSSRPVDEGQVVVHNSYLEILAENGAPALLAFLAFLAGTWRLLARAYREARRRNDPEERRLATTLQAVLVVAIVSSLFLSEQLTTPIWLVGALAVAVAAPHVRATSPASLAPGSIEPAPARA
jgi:putative inorganic carbon (hco3(-)) transporter